MPFAFTRFRRGLRILLDCIGSSGVDKDVLHLRQRASIGALSKRSFQVSIPSICESVVYSILRSRLVRAYSLVALSTVLACSLFFDPSLCSFASNELYRRATDHRSFLCFVSRSLSLSFFSSSSMFLMAALTLETPSMM